MMLFTAKNGNPMHKNYTTATALVIGVFTCTLVGCGLGEPSKSAIETSLRQKYLEMSNEEGAPASYIENLKKNLKVTVLKNNGCQMVGEKTYECDVSLELDVPEYKRGNGLPDLEAVKKTIDLKAKYIMSSSGWEVQSETDR